MTATRKTYERIHNALNAIDKKANVAGWIVLDKTGEHIGTIQISYPRDGAGKLQALAANWAAERPRDENDNANFSTWTPWQYGYANGGGYDKATAALGGMTIEIVTLKDQGFDWSHQLCDAGYRVIQAI